MAPKVSVIIPAYNQAEFLDQAVQSVLDQTEGDFEILIVDDGSTDQTCAVALRFQDPRIRYFYQENRGLSGARNTGLRHATGKWISFLDADDLFLPEKLEVLARLFENRTDLGAVAGQTIAIDPVGNRLGLLSEQVVPPNPLDLILGNPIHVGSVLVRREWIARVGEFDERLRACEDWDLWLRLVKAGCGMAGVARPVSLYRMHRSQMTRDVERMRTAMQTVLEKTFASDDLSEYWQERKNKAYAAIYTKAAIRAYLGGQASQARPDLIRAIQLDPSILENDGEPLAGQLMSWANAPWIEKPLDALKYIYQNLPVELAGMQKHRRKHLAALALEVAYWHKRQSTPAKVRQYLYQAILYQPSRLNNRGIWSMLVRSYLGS